MSRQYDRTYMRSDERNERIKAQRKHTTPAAWIILIILAAGVIAVYFYIKEQHNTSYTSWEWSDKREITQGLEYIYGEKGYAAYGRDGAIGYDLNANQIWNIAFTIKQPIADNCGEWYAFADRGSDRIYITDGTGINTCIDVAGNIRDVKISSVGTTAVLTEGTEKDRIFIYDSNTELLAEINTSVKKAGFPIAIAISPDGRKLVTSYYTVGNESEGRVTFYNFSSVGRSYADNMVGSFSTGESMAVDIEFMGNERVCVFQKDTVEVYKLKEIPEKLKTLSFPEGITAKSTAGSGLAVASSQRDDMSAIVIYNTEGEKTTELATGMSFDRFRITKDELLVLAKGSCVIYRRSDGTVKFRVKPEEGIRLMTETGDSRRYAVVTENSMGTIVLKNSEENSEGEY